MYRIDYMVIVLHFIIFKCTHSTGIMCCDKDTLSCYLDELHSLDEDHVEKHGTLCVGEVRAQGPTSSAAGDSRASLHVLYPMQIRVVPHSAAVHVAGGFLGTR